MAPFTYFQVPLTSNHVILCAVPSSTSTCHHPLVLGVKAKAGPTAKTHITLVASRNNRPKCRLALDTSAPSSLVHMSKSRRCFLPVANQASTHQSQLPSTVASESAPKTPGRRVPYNPSLSGPHGSILVSIGSGPTSSLTANSQHKHHLQQLTLPPVLQPSPRQHDRARWTLQPCTCVITEMDEPRSPNHHKPTPTLPSCEHCTTL